jgi:hypothetical protein
LLQNSQTHSSHIWRSQSSSISKLLLNLFFSSCT